MHNSKRSTFADAMPPKTEKEIRRIFDNVDKDRSGKVTVAELQTLHGGHAEKIVESCDADKDGKVSWDEYIKVMRDRGQVKEEQAEDQKAMPLKTEKEIRRIFNSFDWDRSGKVTVAELQSKVDPQKMLERMDGDKDGKISWDEYIKYMRDRGQVKEEQAEDQKDDF